MIELSRKEFDQIRAISKIPIGAPEIIVIRAAEKLVKEGLFFRSYKVPYRGRSFSGKIYY